MWPRALFVWLRTLDTYLRSARWRSESLCRLPRGAPRVLAEQCGGGSERHGAHPQSLGGPGPSPAETPIRGRATRRSPPLSTDD